MKIVDLYYNILKIQKNKDYSNYDSKIKKIFYIFLERHSIINLLDYILLGTERKSISLFELKYNKFINYYKNNKKIIDINILSKKNEIEYNYNNINFSNDYDNVKLLNPFEIGTIGFNWLNEVIRDHKHLVNQTDAIKIANIDIHFSEYPVSFITGDTYIENISLIKAITLQRKRDAILNYLNDEYDYYYINNPSLSSKIKYINWYKSALNYNIKRLFTTLSLKELCKINKKYNIVYCNLEWKKKNYFTN